MVAVAAQRGLLSRTSVGFRVALLLAVVTVTVGYLYLTRFCDACGRMVRNLKAPTCPRCGAYLPRHGMTSRLRRPGDERLWTPRDRPRPSRSRQPEGPSAGTATPIWPANFRTLWSSPAARRPRRRGGPGSST